MNSFSKYMNNVKAEDNLKAGTKAYVRTALAAKANQQTRTDSLCALKRTNFNMKRLLATASAIAACAILAIGGYAFYNTPANFVSLDINPSVEFGVNAFDTVVSAQAYNEEGTLLLKANRYTYLSIEKAIGVLVREAAEQGFIADDGATVIAVTPASNNEDTASRLQSSCEVGVNSALDAGEMSAIVYSDRIDLQLRTQAREAGVSPGKYRLIEILRSLDTGITVEQYKNMRVTDIIAKANEMLMLSGNSGGENGAFESAFERIQNAAQQVKAAYENAEREQNQGTDSGTQHQAQEQGSGSGTQEQTQEQGSESEEQEQNQNSGATGSEQGQEQNQNQPDDSPSETESAGQNGTGTGQDGSAADSGGSGSSSGSGEFPSGEKPGN